jgi:tetratricopeptide (TPR) repeat protein/predicted Ser/Thr protein kinase
MPLLILRASASDVPMQYWSFTLHGPGGILSTLESGETQFVLGTEQAGDVWSLAGEGVAPRHALVRVAAGRIQVEDLAGGTLVNGHPITGRVEAEYPASVQVGELTLVVEQKDEGPSQAATIVQSPRPGGALLDNLEVPVVTPRAAQQPVVIGSGQSYADHNGRYTLVNEIARGGMGQIYFGKDPQLERQVAVKVSSISEGGEDPRFTKEAKVLALLAHPNIVPIYNVGVDGQGRPFYSMKLVKGRTLQAVLNALKDGDAAATKEYTRAGLLTIFRKVCDAMAFAHAKGILHRDLKPENIMVGEYGEVLVMDWGLAKILGERDAAGVVKAAATDTGDYGMTLEGEVMGTPQYMSPEQAEGMVAELDIRSDIYSLGGILYAVLTLRPPVGGSTLAEVLGNVKSGVLSAMGTATRMTKGIGVRPEPMTVAVPAALQAVTFKAMALNRENRYASVALFAEDIESYQNGFATSAEGAGVWKRVKLWVARNKVLAGAAALLVFVVSGFTGKVVHEGRRATRALQNLADLGPLVAKEAEDSLREGKFEEALARASYAVELDGSLAHSYAIQGHALEVCDRWEEAAQSYRKAQQLGSSHDSKSSLALVEELIALSKTSGIQAARSKLQKALTAQDRTHEAAEYSRLSQIQTGSVKNLQAGKQLVKRLESGLLHIPGTRILMQKTEFTVGEWKLYLAAQGLPPWEDIESKIRHLPKKRGDLRPAMDSFGQTDEHPVVFIAWDQARDLCRWLTKVTGDEWRLPREYEWLAATADQVTVGISEDGVPQGNVYIEDLQTGKTVQTAFKSTHRGIAGVYGTMPVGSFKPNALGFYDLGGNVWEFMWDGALKPGGHVIRGGGWRVDCDQLTMRRGEIAYATADSTGGSDVGFRLVVRKK